MHQSKRAALLVPVFVPFALHGCGGGEHPTPAHKTDSCIKPGDTSWIDCLKPNGRYVLPSGKYFLDRHLQLPDDIHVEGEGQGKTIIEATRAVDNGCGAKADIPGDSKTRIGFVLGNNNYIGKFTFVAKDEHRWQGYNGAALCGGAVFETPGCSDAYCASEDIGGTHHSGNGVRNVTIEEVDVVGSAWNTAPQLAIFVTQTRNLSQPSHDILIRRIKMHHSWADGINLHGAVYNALVEDCDLGCQGDDNLAVWSAGSLATNITFKGNTLSQTSSTNPSKTWGNCVALYGGNEINVIDTQCYGTNDGGVKLASTFHGAFSSSSRVLVQDMSTDNGKPGCYHEHNQAAYAKVNRCSNSAMVDCPDACFVHSGCRAADGISYKNDAFDRSGRGWYCNDGVVANASGHYAECCIHPGCSKAAWDGFMWRCADDMKRIMV